ncbi:NlpC/P60 family protein [Faecalimicrobium sp. JNUCC 81]
MQYCKDNQEKKLLKLAIKMLGLFSLASLFFIIFISSAMIFFYSSNVNDDSMRVHGSLSGVPTEYIPYFNEASEIFNIPNWALASVAKQESNFNPNTAYLGAFGLMQIQKYDWASGKDLWAYLIGNGLGEIYKNAGYSFSSSEEMWNIFLGDVRAQIIAGSYEIRYYANYVLYKYNKVNKLNYNSNENMNLIPWNASEDDSELRELLRRTYACYNGGPGYGIKVDLDTARFDYPNKVYRYAMEYRGSGLDFSDGSYVGDNETIEKAISAGMPLVGNSPYVWGGGRNPYDVAHRRFDCSSFVHWCFSQAGINLGDYRSVVTDSLARQGRAVNASEITRGDILFFNTYKYNGHVGIYLGGGKFLHCGTSKGVWIDDMNSSYWSKVFNGNVRRIVETK